MKNQKLPNKKTNPKWKVQYVSYKKVDIENFDQTNPRKTWDVNKDRWKPIPILYREQEKALIILESDNYKRPLVKTVKFYFGEETSLYGGRKGFTDLMLSKGNTLENISVWMGHSTINRTWKSYKNRRKYHIQYGT